MESIGEKLRLAREKNNYTIEQVARDTHVAKRFLKALEDEDFATFPGETYAMGFLRNYAEYLGLNAEELVTLYRNMKIQEQPLPMTELLEARPRLNVRLLAIIVVAAVVVLGAGGYLVFRAVSPRGRPSGTAEQQALLSKDVEQFVFQEEVRTKWFSQGSVIRIPIGQKTYSVEVASIGDAVTLKVPGGTVELNLGKERLIDLEGDSNPDLKVVWNDTDRTSTVKRANLGLYRVSGAVGGAEAAAGTETAAAARTPSSEEPVPQPAAAPPVRAADFKTSAVARGQNADPFTVDLIFRDYCLFRFLADTKDREERFFQRGESFKLDARKALTLWISNSGAVKAKVAGKDVEMGRLGEVAVRKIAWRKDASAGDYVLEVTALY
jgi:cytoskeleton protein RodZ